MLAKPSDGTGVSRWQILRSCTTGSQSLPDSAEVLPPRRFLQLYRSRPQEELLLAVAQRCAASKFEWPTGADTNEDHGFLAGSSPSELGPLAHPAGA